MAVALVGGLLLPFVWPISVVRYTVLACVAAGLAAALYFATLGMRRRDPYDLEALREVHEREAVQALLDDEPTPDSDSVVCRNCGACYPAGIGVCPECGCIAGH